MNHLVEILFMVINKQLNVIHSATYRIFITSILPLVLVGFLWTLAVPYFYSVMDNNKVVLEWMDPISNSAEEENVENINELEKDLKLRFISPNLLTLTTESTSYSASFESFSDFNFLETPNPPPEIILSV